MKRGFTLSEVLIVLVIIGALSALTLPGFIGSTQTSQRKTAFKKAFSNLSNAYALEFATKSAPANNTDINKIKNALANNLNIKYYINNNTKVFEMPSGNALNFWYVTEDNIAYKVNANSTAVNCATKLSINAKESTAEAKAATCFSVTIDVDCIGKGKTSCAVIGDSDDLDTFTGNEIDVFVSSTGLATGHPDKTISGRILSQG